MGRLSRKIALITGAGSGIGQATARLFAHEGAVVIATDLNKENVESTVKELVDKGYEAYALKHDVTNRKDWQEVIKFANDKDLKINVLCNIAGISSEVPFGQLDEDEWNKVFKINMESIFIGTQEVIKEMVEQKKGVIINVSSMCGILGSCGAGPYAASKAAVANFTKSIAHDFAAENIRCNSIHPGYIATNMTKELFENPQMMAYFQENTPLPCLGRPNDIAYGMVYLASEEAQFVTGIQLVIDGGVVNTH